MASCESANYRGNATESRVGLRVPGGHRCPEPAIPSSSREGGPSVRRRRRHLRRARPREFDRHENQFRAGLGRVVRHSFGNHDEVAPGHAPRFAALNGPAHRLAVLPGLDDFAARGDGAGAPDDSPHFGFRSMGVGVLRHSAPVNLKSIGEPCNGSGVATVDERSVGADAVRWQPSDGRLNVCVRNVSGSDGSYVAASLAASGLPSVGVVNPPCWVDPEVTSIMRMATAAAKVLIFNPPARSERWRVGRF